MGKRRKKLVVSRKNVKEQDYDIVDSFAASNHWLSNLMVLNELSVRDSKVIKYHAFWL